VAGEPDIAAALLLGMLNEAALLIAASPTPASETTRVAATVDAFVERLLPRDP
jgi:hypothetical protein